MPAKEAVKEKPIRKVRKKAKKKITKRAVKKVAKKATAKRKAAKKKTTKKAPVRKNVKKTTKEVDWSDPLSMAKYLKDNEDKRIVKNKAKEAKEYKYHDFINLMKLPKKSVARIPELSTKKQSPSEMRMLANSMAAADLLTKGKEEVQAEELVYWSDDAVAAIRATVAKAMSKDSVPGRDIRQIAGPEYHLKRRAERLNMQNEIKELRESGLVPSVYADRRQGAWNFSVADWENLMSKFPDPEAALKKAAEEMADPKVTAEANSKFAPMQTPTEKLAEALAPELSLALKEDVRTEPSKNLLDQMDDKYVSTKIDCLMAKKALSAAERDFQEGSGPIDLVGKHTKAWLKARRDFAAMQQLYGV
jgi:hypothetical protein